MKPKRPLLPCAPLRRAAVPLVTPRTLHPAWTGSVYSLDPGPAGSDSLVGPGPRGRGGFGGKGCAAHRGPLHTPSLHRDRPGKQAPWESRWGVSPPQGRGRSVLPTKGGCPKEGAGSSAGSEVVEAPEAGPCRACRAG